MVNGWALKPCKHLQIKNMETDTEHLQNEKKKYGRVSLNQNSLFHLLKKKFKDSFS